MKDKTEQIFFAESFLTFCKKYNIASAALFACTGNTFYIQKAYNIDLETINKSYSTKDFWNGIISEYNIIYDSDDNNDLLMALFQFFSFEIRNNIQNIKCLKISINNIDYILLIINSKNKDIIPLNIKLDLITLQTNIEDTDLLIENKLNIQDCYLYKINLKKELEVIDKIELKNTALEMIQDYLIKLFNNNIICKHNNFNINIALFIQNKKSEKIIEEIILKKMNKYLKSEKNICFTKKENSCNKESIINFLEDKE